MDIDNLETEKLWELYGKIIKKLADLGAIRTKNITSERGEHLAIDFYNSTRGLPKLQLAPQGTKNVDALSRSGDRYSIKTVKLPGKTTGVFYGLGTPEEPVSEKKFEYLIIVMINDSYRLEKIIELTWENFFNLKRWHSRMRAYNITISNSLLENSKIIYQK